MYCFNKQQYLELLVDRDSVVLLVDRDSVVLLVDRDSVACIATRYCLDGLGIESQ